MKKALNRLGYYIPYEKVGIIGIPDQRMFDAIKSFQRMKNLHTNGQIRPGDETETAINAALLEPKEGYYIWRSVEDGKVRAAHTQYNRTVLAWLDSPDPGEDFGCRCWAEAVQNDHFLSPRGLNIPQSSYDPEYPNFPDAINPTISPLDFLLGALLLKGGLRIGLGILLSASRILSLSPKLNENQQKNLIRFIKKIPANSKDNIEITKLQNGNIKFTAISKGKVPGSKAKYEKIVNSERKTVNYTKTTYGKNNEIIHIKNKID